MPGRDRRLDPRTGDYIPDGAGGYQHTTTIETEIQHQLKAVFGSWWGDDKAGSRLRELLTGHIDAPTRVLAKRYAQLALQPFVDAGRGRDLTIKVSTEAQQYRIEIDLVDTQSNTPISTSFVTALEDPGEV